MAAFAISPDKGWHVPYLGVPFVWRGRGAAGWDCWGMYRHCLAAHFGVAAPDYLDGYGANDQALGRRDRLALQARLFEARHESWRRIERPELGAGVLLRVDGAPVHVGLFLGGTDFLHVTRSHGTHVASLTDADWRGNDGSARGRVEGFYVPA